MKAFALKKVRGAAFAVLIAAVIFIAGVGAPFQLARATGAGVPTADGGAFSQGLIKIAKAVANLAQSTITATKTFAIHLKEYVGDSMANMLAKAALRSITQSTVNWINSGFKGSPAFITNPEGFLTDVADQVIGQAIDAAAPLLCSPFQLDIRLALGLQYTFGASRDIRCRLTDVIANLQGSYNQFVAGDFRAGGWNSFINIAGVPQNNPYGAYLATQDYLGLQIVSATGYESKRLEFGRGFLDWRECEIPGDPIVVKNGTRTITRHGPCKKKGPVKTPGSVIEGQLQSTLNVDLQGLALADEINEIFDALIKQLVNKVFSRGGLASASNYRDDFSTDTVLQTSDANSPEINQAISDLNRRLREDEMRQNLKNELGAGPNRDEILKEVNAGIETGTQAFGGNIALGKLASQSSVYTPGGGKIRYHPDAGRAVDRFTEGDYTYGLSVTNARSTQQQEQWWQVDLETNQERLRWTVNEITEIKVYGATGDRYGDDTLYDYGFKLYVTNADPSAKTVQTLDADADTVTHSFQKIATGAGSNMVSVPFSPPIRGRFVKIVNFTGDQRMSIAEVQVFGTQTAGQVTRTPDSTVPPLQVQLAPLTVTPEETSTKENRVLRPPPPTSQNANATFQIKNTGAQASPFTIKTTIVEGGAQGQVPFGKRMAHFDLIVTDAAGQTLIRRQWTCDTLGQLQTCRGILDQTTQSGAGVENLVNATSYRAANLLGAGEEVTVALSANILTGYGARLIGTEFNSLFDSSGIIKTEVFAGTQTTPSDAHEWRFSK